MASFTCRQIFSVTLLAACFSCAQAGELNVSAASSLTNAFKEIAASYQTQFPDAKVQINFGASGALLQQLAKGAPVDVLATADQETMDAAEQQNLIIPKERKNFVRNSLVLIQAVGDANKIQRIEDLQQVGIKRIAIGNPASVPVGRYAMQAINTAKILPAIKDKLINTQNVRQSLDYVARAEVDAGFVYATDAAIMSDKVKISIHLALEQTISYPVAVSKDSNNAQEAKRFVQFLLSPPAQTILAKYGFQKP
nr:molybdate ABC transporter substrate-binding protein [uncultured Undibacterium sp.]